MVLNAGANWANSAILAGSGMKLVLQIPKRAREAVGVRERSRVGHDPMPESWPTDRLQSGLFIYVGWVKVA